MNRFTAARERVALTADNAADKDLYEHYRDERGFNAFAFGQWQIDYADMVIAVLGLRAGESLLDIGCAGGANTEAFLRRGLDAWGIDICRYMIEQTPHAQGRLKCAGADDLSVFADCYFDVVHSNQVFEHVPEDRCEAMFAELRRVLRPGGKLFAGLVVGDSQSDFDPHDDCTHVNVKPWKFWEELATRHGFMRRQSYESATRCHPFFKAHPFDLAVWRRC